MRKILVLFISVFLSLNVFAAGGDGGGSSGSSGGSSYSNVSMYDQGIKLVKRADLTLNMWLSIWDTDGVTLC